MLLVVEQTMAFLAVFTTNSWLLIATIRSSFGMYICLILVLRFKDNHCSYWDIHARCHGLLKVIVYQMAVLLLLFNIMLHPL